MVVEYTVEDVLSAEVGSIIRAHLDFCVSNTPSEGVFARSAESLSQNGVTLFGVRTDGSLQGICALATMDEFHVELKSMHVISSARGAGLAAGLVAHVLSVAADRGATRVSLETGAHDAFRPARSLYERLGFSYTTPFGTYGDVPTSVFMTLELPVQPINLRSLG